MKFTLVPLILILFSLLVQLYLLNQESARWKALDQKSMMQTEAALETAKNWQEAAEKWEKNSNSFEGINRKNMETIERYHQMMRAIR
jgi:hypothetical protein